LQSIGIFGGTFDPIHFGHLRMAEELRVQLGLEQVRILPAAQPPHRDGTHTSAQHRAAMVGLAIADNPAFVLDQRELERNGPSYTVDTLRSLREECGDATPLILFVGSDAFFGLTGWHRWQELPTLAHIAVAFRPGTALQEDTLPHELRSLWQRHQAERLADLHDAPAGKMIWQSITALDIASSKIRDAYARDFSTRYLLPETVRGYIESHHLYARRAT
jgi:nicotinate-nucleotide adenylyltransferase